MGAGMTELRRPFLTPDGDEPPLRLDDPALVLEGVGVRVGSATLLADVDLVVEPGRIVAILGANGAGKTTLLDAISGTVRARGDVVVAGRQRRRGAGPDRGVARVFQGSPLPETLTVAEVVDVRTRDRARAAAVLRRFGLAEHADSFAGELSTGMRRVLDLALATVDEPSLLLLDEPASGLAASEVDHLAELVRRHRDETGCAVLVVEHDPGFVERIADEVVVLDRGRVVRHGALAEVLVDRGHPEAATRVASPLDEAFRDRLERVSEVAAPPEPPLRRQLSTWTKLRLGLREFAAGMASVLTLGVLNRVMKVELGISLAVVATLLASYNLAAPFAMAVGHASDRRPILGRHRTPYIIGGTVLSATAVALSPHVADALAGGLHLGTLALALGLFILMGFGMYTSGTVFFALIADLTPRAERGHAASIVYLELMLGIMAGVALSTTLLDDAANGLHTLFAITGLLVVLLTVVAVWGLDPGEVEEEPGGDVGVVQAVRDVAALPTARKFFAFMFLVTLFLFLQQAVLEPFGGEVLGLSVRATSGFNAVQTLGVLVGMVITGKATADRTGHKRTALVGLYGASASFGALTFAAITQSAPPSWFAILLVGLSTGLFNVATLALMMAMADPRRMALFMGAWTVAHALADGMATAGGGVVYEAALWVAGDNAGAYATVFAFEAIGLAACIPLLRAIDPDRFALEVATESARRAAAQMGWMAPVEVLDRKQRRAAARARATARRSGTGAADDAPVPATLSMPMPAALTVEARAARRRALDEPREAEGDRPT